MADQKRFVIWGSAGHAKVLADLVALQGGTVIAIFDNRNVPSAIPDIPIYVGEEGFRYWVNNFGDISDLIGLVAIGGKGGRDRIAIQRLFDEFGLRLTSIVHPSAAISKTASLGPGTQVLALAVVAADTKLGAACIVNNHASIDHECILGDGVHIAPGAILCGCVNVEDYVFVGSGAVILPRLKIGRGATIGAGAVVTRNVAPESTVVGNPAHPI